MEFDLEWKPVGQEKLYSKADLSKQKLNGPVSCRQHSYFGICPLYTFKNIFRNKKTMVFIDG